MPPFPPDDHRPHPGGPAGYPTPEDIRRRRRTMRTFRWVMTGAGLVAGIVLVVSGATLVGVVIGGMALLRGVMLLTMGRQMRRRARGRRRGWAPNPVPPASPPPM